MVIIYKYDIYHLNIIMIIMSINGKVSQLFMIVFNYCAFSTDTRYRTFIYSSVIDKTEKH